MTETAVKGLLVNYYWVFRLLDFQKDRALRLTIGAPLSSENGIKIAEESSR